MGLRTAPRSVEPIVMAEILIDTDTLIDISRDVISTAQYLAQASATTTFSISSITQIEIIVGC